MLAEIGLMVGCYILVRAMSFIERRGDREEPQIVRFLSVVAAIVTLVMMSDFLLGWSHQGTKFP